MGQPAGNDQLLQLLHGRRHAGVPLPNLDHCQPPVGHPQIDGRRSPAIKPDLLEVVTLRILVNLPVDPLIVDHIARNRRDPASARPRIVGHLVTPAALMHGRLRHPKARQHPEIGIVLRRREHQHKGRNIQRVGEVQPGVAGAPIEQADVERTATRPPLVRVNEVLRRACPDVQPLGQEGGQSAGQLLRLARLLAQVVQVDRDAQVRVGLDPIRFVPLVVALVKREDDPQMAVILDHTVQHLRRVLAPLVAERRLVEAGRRNAEHERLCSRARARLQHIPDLRRPVRVQLVDNRTMYVQPVHRVGVTPQRHIL